jgi:hypothetical protein
MEGSPDENINEDRGYKSEDLSDENMENSLTKVVRASRRSKRSPLTKSNDFLW